MEVINQSEIIGERFNDARDFVRNAMKSFNDWKAFYGITTVAEAYARGDIEIHLHLFSHHHFGMSVNKTKGRNATFLKRHNIPNFCIRMQRHPFIEFASSTDKSVKSETPQSWSQDSNEAMFVGIVKLLKKKKGVMPTLIPSLVWLKRLEYFKKPLVDVSNVSIDDPTIHPRPISETSSMFPIISCPCSLADGKLSNGVGVVSDTPQLPSQEVKGRTQVMGNLSNYYHPLIGKCGTIINSDVLTAGFSIELGQDDGVAIYFEEPLSNLLEGYELAICPLDLSSWPIKWMHPISSIDEEV